MKFSALFCALLSAASVSAMVFNVTVGENNELAFNPTSVSGAVAGDQIVFKFISKNHTVTQSTFGSPCTKEGPSAFDSGFQPANASSQPTFTVTLDEQSASVPQWFYCKQKTPVSHCHKGMVFAINPTANKTFAQYQKNAIDDAQNPSTSGTPCTTGSATSTPTATPAPDATPSPQTAGNGSTTATPAPDATPSPQTAGNGSTTATPAPDATPSPQTAGNGSTTATPAPNATPSPNTSGKVHSILVGNNNSLTFEPPSIQAAAGDTIEFTFLSKNHTVTQSTFTSPCALAPGGVNSGFQPVSANSTTTMQWSITLDAKSASSPLWFFCAQANPVNHCQKGMVFAINANANKTFEQYKTNAINSGASNGTNSSSSSGSYGGSNSSASNGSATATAQPSPTSASINVGANNNGAAGLRGSVNTVVLMALVGLVASFSI